MLKKPVKLFFFVFLFLLSCSQNSKPSLETNIKSHDDLVKFFQAWRTFNEPMMHDGVPDYTKAAMDKQYKELPGWQARLKSIDTTGWPVSDKIDWTLIWAEMNGMNFEHRVTQPWVRDPAYYVWFYPDLADTPTREGPTIHGNIEYAYFSQPLSDTDAASIAERLRKTRAVYERAKINLTGNARDLWVLGIRSIKAQSEDLTRFAQSVETKHPDLASAAVEAAKASDQFAGWLEKQAASKTGPSGIGKDNYNWYLKNVHLRNFTWDEEVLLLQRELARAHTSLRLEENRNRKLPKLSSMANAAEYDRRMNEAVDEYAAFLKKQEIFTIKEYVEPALRNRVGKYSESSGLRNFFAEITYRGPIVMRTHDTHWIELARMREEPHLNPIRRQALLYNIFDGRSEGLATAMEEMMMHSGFLDEKPRARELIWMLLAMRAARGLGGLYQHGLEMTFDEATQFASKWTPWGLLPADGSTIQWEEHFYLRQPAYGESYNIGKIEIEELITEYARQREGRFVLKEFMNHLFNSGVIPVSLLYWEMTGEKANKTEAR